LATLFHLKALGKVSNMRPLNFIRQP